MAAKGLPVSFTRYFNSLDDWTGQLGKRGRFSVGNDLALYECDGLGSRCLFGPSGFRVRFARQSGGVYKTPPNAGNVTLSRTGPSSGNFTLTDNRSGTKWNFFDNSFSFNNSITDRYGNTISFEANGTNGSLSKITDANGRQYPVTTDSSARVTKIEVPSAQFAGGLSWQYGYNAGGDLTSVTDPEGYVTTYTYTSGDLTKITDARSNDTIIAYDALKRVTSVTRKIDGTVANDITTTYSYPAVDSACDKTTGGSDSRVVGKTIVTDPNGKVTTYCYAQSGAVVKALKTVNGNTQITDNTYTSNGNVDKITGFSGTGNFAEQFAFDPTIDQNLTKVTGGEGEVTDYTYFAPGGSDPLEKYRVHYVKDPQNNVTDYTYDGDGNVGRVDNSETGLGTQNVEMNWNTTAGDPLRGTLTSSKDGNTNQTSYGYDALARLSTITTANPTALPVTTITYDGLSRIKTVKDGRNKTTTYNYDKLGRITSLVDNGTITQTYGYDANGNNTARSEPGKTSSYTYDKLNRKTAESFPGDSASYTWDKGSNLKTLTDFGGTSTYTYDEVNRIKTLVAPAAVSGTDTTTFDWTEPTTPGTTTSWKTTTLPGGGKIKDTFDRSGKRFETLVTNSAAAQTLRRTYKYQTFQVGGPAHSRMDFGSEQNGPSDPKVNRVYEYDASGRVTKVEKLDADKGFALLARDSFDYDGAGNRLHRTRLVGSTTTYDSYGYNNVNQLCWRSATNVATPTCASTPGGATSYAYDAVGNTTAGDVAATYDDKSRLATLAGASLTHLSPTNWELTAVGTASYRNNILGVGYINAAGNASKLQRSPDDGSVVSQVRDSTKQWLVDDQVGSTVALIDSTGALRRTYTYDVDGNSTTTAYGTGTNPETWIKYAGGHDIGNGLYHYGQRYYQPLIGRWTQQDPLLQPGDLGQANRYGYVANDPINSVDRAGLLGSKSYWAEKCANGGKGKYFQCGGLHPSSKVGQAQAVCLGGALLAVGSAGSLAAAGAGAVTASEATLSGGGSAAVSFGCALGS